MLHSSKTRSGVEQACFAWLPSIIQSSGFNMSALSGGAPLLHRPRRIRYDRSAGWWPTPRLMLCSLFSLLCAVSCAATSTTPAVTTAPSTVADYDPDRAFLRLNEIMPVPHLASASTVEATEPPPPALRYLRKGRERFDDRLWADAIAALEKSLQIHPGLVDARILLARAALRQGNRGLAETHLREAITQRPDDVAVHQLLGEIAWQDSHADEAIRSFRLALSAHNAAPDRPETVLTHLSLAMALRKAGYLTAAVDQLEAYQAAVQKPMPDMKAYPELKEVIVLYRGTAAGLLGEIYTRLGRHDHAVEAYERAVTEAPEEAAFSVRLARSLARAGRVQDALDVVHRVLTKAPDKAEGLDLLGEICTIAGEPDRYDAEIARLAAGSREPALQLKLTEVLAEHGKTDAAIDVLERMLAANPDRTDALQRLADLYLKDHQVDGFVQVLARLLHDPTVPNDGPAALLDQAVADTSTGSRLLQAARNRAEQAPSDAAARSVYGRVLAATGRLDAAITELQRAVQLEPKSAANRVALARTLLAARQWAAAVEAADAAIAAGLRTSETLFIKGQAHLALDQLDDAETALREAYRLKRDSLDVMLAMADLAKRRRDFRLFEQIHTRIIEDLDPRYLPSREALIRLYLDAKQLQQARSLFAEFARLKLEGPAVDRCDVLIRFAAGELDLNAYRAVLRGLIEAHPDDIITRVYLMRSLGETKDYAQCLAAADPILTRDPDSIETQDLKATALMKLLRFEEAKAVLRDLLVAQPRNIKWQLELVEISLDQGHFDQAIARLRDMLKRDDLGQTRDLFTDQLIREYLLADRMDDAVQTAKDWLDDTPDDEYRRNIYLRTLSAADRHDEAVRTARQWLDDDPTGAEPRRQLILQLKAAEHHVEAQQVILSWLADDPDDEMLNLYLIDALWSDRQWESAIEISSVGAELPGQREGYRRWLARTYLLAGRFDEAIEHFQAEVSASPNEDSYQQLIIALVAAERFQEAESMINKLLGSVTGRGAQSPLVESLKGILATLCQRTHRLDKALHYLEELYAADPKDAGRCNNLGYTLVDTGRDLDRAEKLIRHAVGEEPRNSAYLDSLGWLLYKQGDFEQAIRYIDLALRQERDDDAVILDHMGDALYRSGSADRAKSFWKKAEDRIDKDAAGDRPIDIEQRQLRKQIRAKLDQARSGDAVETAPVGKQSQATSKPAHPATEPTAGP